MAYVRAALERNGYSVVCTESGVDGLAAARDAESFMGVVSDMRTPGGVDGADVYAWIAATPPRTGSRLVFITGDIANEETVATLAENRRAVRGETISGAAIYFRGRADHGESTVTKTFESVF